MHAQANGAAKPSLEFKDALKQRVCYYFQAHPDGDWQHFLENWPRAHQVDRSKFKEVHRAMQVAGMIPLIEGGRAHEILKKEIEKDVRAKVEQEMAEKDKEVWGAAAPEAAAQIPPVPALQNEPVTSENQSTTPPVESKESKMPIKSARFAIDAETKEKVYRIISASPNINWADFQKKMGASLGKMSPANFYLYRNKIKKGKFKVGDDGSRSAPASGGSAAPSLVAPAANGPTIVKSIPCDAMDKTVKKTLKDYLPSILTQLLGTKMSFKVLEVVEDDEPRLMILRTA